MKKTYFLILFLFSALLILNSCTDPLLVKNTFPKSLLEWMYFKGGTRWTYNLDSTSINETIVVDSSLIYVDVREDRTVKLEKGTFKVFAHSLKDRYGYVYTGIDSRVDGCTSDSCSVVIRQRGIIGSPLTEYSEYSDLLLYPIKKGIKGSASGWTYTTLSNIYDSLIVRGKTYYNVVEMHETANATEDGRETKFYIAKNFGIIRKVIYTPGQQTQQWNLTDSKIIQ